MNLPLFLVLTVAVGALVSCYVQVSEAAQARPIRVRADRRSDRR